MPTRARTEKYAADPMVPIAPNALAWALDKQQVSASELARRLGTSQQAIAHLLPSRKLGDDAEEPPRRCRRSRLKAIARELRLAESFLRGDGMVLPATVRYGNAYSPAVRLAAGRLCGMARDACVRDMRAAAKRGEPAPSVRDDPSREIVDCIGELLNVQSWQRLLLADGEGRPLLPMWQEVLKPTPKRAPNPYVERAMLGLIDAFEEILTPWLTNRARLDYGRLRDLTVLPAHEPAPARTNPADLIPTWESWTDPRSRVEPPERAK